MNRVAARGGRAPPLVEDRMTERVLVVDDDDALRESLELVLAEEGYDVAGARDGAEALARIEAEPIDIVLCDVRMPGMDGMELLPDLIRRLPGATLVMMSAYGSSDLAIEALRHGAYDYLSKPFQPSEVLLTLRGARPGADARRVVECLTAGAVDLVRQTIRAALDEAAELATAIGANLLLAAVEEQRGQLGTDTSERHLREAHRLFTEMGATGHAERVARELGA